MLRARNAISAIAFTAIGTFLFATDIDAQVTSYAPQVGKPHTDFILPSIRDGRPLQLSSYRGKKVLLMHFASW